MLNCFLLFPLNSVDFSCLFAVKFIFHFFLISRRCLEMNERKGKKTKMSKVEGKLRQIAGKLLAWIEHSLPYKTKENYLFKYFCALQPSYKKKEGEKPHQNSKISFSAHGGGVEGKRKKERTSEARKCGINRFRIFILEFMWNFSDELDKGKLVNHRYTPWSS